MNFIYILLICIFVVVILFLIFLLIRRYLKGREIKNRLFGEGLPIFLKGFIKKLNPFLIVKKKTESIELNIPKADAGESDAINIQKGSRKKGEPKSDLSLEARNIKGKRNVTNVPVTKAQKAKAKKKTFPKSAVLIKIKNLEELSKRLKNKDLIYILDFLKKEDYALLERLFLGKQFKSQSEFINYFKEEFVRFLNSEVNILKGRLSDLRKKGKDVSQLDLKIMAIPLKIRLFAATFSKKDFDKVTNLLKEADDALKLKEKQIQLKEAENVPKLEEKQIESKDVKKPLKLKEKRTKLKGKK